MNILVKVMTGIAVSAFFAASSQAFADTIFMRNGQRVDDAKIVRIGTDEIDYKIGEREFSYSVKKADVDRIVYDDGTQDMFDAPRNAPPAATANTAVAPAPAPQTQTTAVSPKVKNGFDGIEGRFAFSAYDMGGGTSGWGMLAAAALRLPFSDMITFKPELNFTYRTPRIAKSGSYGWPSYDPNEDITKENRHTFSDISVGAQAIFHGMVSRESKVFVETGVKLDLPVWANEKTKSWTYNGPNTGATSDSDEYTFTNARSTVDFAFVYGFGLNITDKMAVGVRRMRMINDHDRLNSSALNQTDLSLIILFTGDKL